MNFEILFLFIVVGIAIFTQILKQMARKPKQPKKSAVGWRRGLEKLLEEFRQEMAGPKEGAETAEQPASPSSWWEDLMPQEKAAPQRVSEARIAASREEKASVAAERRQARPAAKVREVEADTPKAKPEGVSKMLLREKPERLSRQDLRQAVVWSEILAAPLGIRGPHA